MRRIHLGYLTIALIVSALICLASLLVFPSWGKAPLAIVFLAALVDPRKTLESSSDSSSPALPPVPSSPSISVSVSSAAPADPLDIIQQQGVPIWNAWREQHPKVKPDLRDAPLDRAKLPEINLDGTVLESASLDRANLSRSILTKADLRHAKLFGAVLTRADCQDAIFRNADLRSANLAGANCQDAILRDANLRNANLHGANLMGADLRGAKLGGADLTLADLTGAILTEAELHTVNLRWAKMGSTSLMDVDLSTAQGLDTVIHDPLAPSFVGMKTITRSGANISESFLSGTDLPETIEFMRSAAGRAPTPRFYSCFISYSSLDERFATRLRNELMRRTVQCWFAPADLKSGDEFRPRIQDAIFQRERLLLILSEHSVDSKWVRKEVRRALKKESEQNCKILVPIRLDNAAFSSTAEWARRISEHRHVGDFRPPDEDKLEDEAKKEAKREVHYYQALADLLDALDVNRRVTS